jgi:hypothetical protein
MGHVLPNSEHPPLIVTPSIAEFRGALTLREADGRMEPDSPTIQTNHAY